MEITGATGAAIFMLIILVFITIIVGPTIYRDWKKKHTH